MRSLRKHWDTIRQRYRVKQIGIFGSYVRGEQRSRSDVDILVDYEKTPDLLEFIGLANYLEDILGKKVDLVRKQAIRPELRNIILDEVVYL